MNTVHRQFGKLMSKGAGDSAKVSALLNDFEEADKCLTKIIEASKAWRDAWNSILSLQVGTVTALEELYSPIVGASDGSGREPAMTPLEKLERTARLKEVYNDLKTDLVDEVNMMDSRIIQPATDAKEHLQPIRKTIKKRENKRLDWERYTDRVSHAQKKLKRTDRENAALVKAEEDAARAGEEFRVADAHLQETLPPLISAAFSILPHLLAVQIMIQNTVLAQYYTVLHNYCEENGFPSPSPPMDNVVAAWSQDFQPILQEVENLTVIARGKAVHQPFSSSDDSRGRKPSFGPGIGARNGLSSRTMSGQSVQSAGAVSPTQTRVLRAPSPGASRARSLSPLPSSGVHNGHDTSPAAKKKPPPPPPKRLGSDNALYAIALYDYAGQSEGDLQFSEGDRIRVVRKTDSTQDWWVGELRGVKGNFPANYCRLA
ncbi:hypothetical protein F5884DRAFT_236504 [Xylogone sp. PMI_703]|nr:hypothetical protein F5884DRAFT_236504 [Xylogone sp. PMI_703]